MKAVDGLTTEKREKRNWEDAFIAALHKSGNVSEACRRAKISRQAAYQLREEAADFAERWESALEAATDSLELEARRRAATGVLEPVYYQGQKVGSVRRYSDTLLIFLLKAHRPEKFRDNVDVTSGGQPLRIKVSLKDSDD